MQQAYSYGGDAKPEAPALQCNGSGGCMQWFYQEDLAEGVVPDDFLEFQVRRASPRRCSLHYNLVTHHTANHIKRLIRE